MEFKQQYFDIWTSAWNLHKEFYKTAKNDDTSWNALNCRYDELIKKFNNKFAEQLLTVVVAEIERRANETPVK